DGPGHALRGARQAREARPHRGPRAGGTTPALPAHRTGRNDARDPAHQPERLRRDRPRPDEARRAVSALIRLYPRAWRERYEDEFLALLEARPPTIGDR